MIRQSAAVLACFLLLDGLLATTAHATAAECAALKFKAAGSDYARKTRCHARSATYGYALIPDCILKSEDKFAAAFQRAETGGACAGAASAIEEQVDACVTGLVATLAATDCPPGQVTTVHGVVTAPNGTLPIPNATVFVPNGPVGSLPAGATCAKCGTILGATPLVRTTTGTTGAFSLTGVPPGTNVPLVIQIGKWRRQVVLPNVPACTDTAVAASLTRLPRTRSEGDIPSIAVSTGNAGSLECLLRKVGIADSEFDTPPSAARVHLFTGNGTDQFDAGVANGRAFAASTSLWSAKSSLEPYDMVLLSCEGAQNANTKPASALQAMKDYADEGGRVYAEHWQNYWLAAGPSPWPSIVTFNTGLADPGTFTADVDTSPGRNATFADWLVATQASTTRGKIDIVGGKQTAVGIDSTRATRMIYRNAPVGGQPSIQYATFTTPAEQPESDRCGRVVFSDMHASPGDRSSSTLTFPSGGCTTGVASLTPQEKALVFALFDLGSCVGTAP